MLYLIVAAGTTDRTFRGDREVKGPRLELNLGELLKQPEQFDFICTLFFFFYLAGGVQIEYKVFNRLTDIKSVF